MYQLVASRPFKKAYATNSTATQFASKVPTFLEPSGDGVIVLGGSGISPVPSHIKIIPYAICGDNDTADMRVIGWNRVGAGEQPNTLWFPTPLAQFTVTFSAAVGLATAPILNTERFADTIIIHATIVLQPKFTDTDSGGAASRGGVQIISAANDLIAQIIMPTFACEKLEITFDSTAVGTTSMNALYALLGG